jgi:hypothetical protein
LTFHLEVKHSKRPAADAPKVPLHDRLTLDLTGLMPPDATCLVVQVSTPRLGLGGKALLICYRGRALVVKLKAGDGVLGDAESHAIASLRAGGIRVEVARSYGAALEHVRDFGIPFCEKDSRSTVENFFKRESARGRA